MAELQSVFWFSQNPEPNFPRNSTILPGSCTSEAMKTTLFSICAFLFLTACQPRDPEVLTQEDKKLTQKSEDKCRTRLPEKMELALGALVGGRKDQSLQILKLGVELANAEKDSLNRGCLQIRQTNFEKTRPSYHLSYQLCRHRHPEWEATQAGTAELSLILDKNQKLRSLGYRSYPFEDRNTQALTIQASKKRSKDTLFLQDQITLSLTRKDLEPGFTVERAQFRTRLRSGFEATSTVSEIFMDSFGELDLDQGGTWSSEVFGEASNLSAECETRTPSTFTMLVNQEAEPDLYSYKMLLFGKVEKSGQLVVDDLSVESHTKNSKTQNEDIVSAGKNKIHSETDLPAWYFWF